MRVGRTSTRREDVVTLGAFTFVLLPLAVLVTLVACVATGAAMGAGAFGDRILARAAPGAAAPADPRVVLWGDSLAWESRGAFQETAQAAGAQVRTRTFGGTAPCDWLADIPIQIREWRPTDAVLSFSGNALSACMRGRDVVDAYRADGEAAVRLLRAGGVRVWLAVAPPRPDQPVRTDGMTDLDRVLRSIAAVHDQTGVVFADLVVTARGRWAARLPCRPGEPCQPDGQVRVRGPDRVHFCPVPTPAMTECPVYNAGAERYGAAMAAPFLARSPAT
ncbi:hypothetical protein I6A81_05790 [Frankia sp. CN7]|uniref:Uncharacterized protein n=2 Tax=Frankia nepalensis TaxID=1836974 RepID=A0A937RDY9_9ACTN|nr:hypothetical protein [Frankia nepalensis]MBL7495781.1 hypothetical protein [Frankia nepalensis]MBL7627109.1 hypothetical protein [Frankia nepalensis]